MAHDAVTAVVTIRAERFNRWLPQLVAAVAEVGGMDAAQLVAPGRTAWPVTLRAAIVLAAIDVMGKKYADVARALGGRNHGSIINAYDCARRRLDIDAEFRQLATLVLAIARAIAGKEVAAPEVQPELQL